MATATNPVTGDLIKTKGSNDQYRSGWDRIFGNKDKQVETKDEPTDVKQDTKQD